MKKITLSADEKLIEAACERTQAEHTTLDELFAIGSKIIRINRSGCSATMKRLPIYKVDFVSVANYLGTR